jgi:hypothetical protein
MSGDVDPVSAGPSAMALLNRAFPGGNSTAEAFSEAQRGVHGGVRLVLDRISAQLKRERCDSYVTSVLQDALLSLGWSRRVAITRAFFERCAATLPRELVRGTPERYAHHLGELLNAYVNGMESVAGVIQRL